MLKSAILNHRKAVFKFQSPLYRVNVEIKEGAESHLKYASFNPLYIGSMLKLVYLLDTL